MALVYELARRDAQRTRDTWAGHNEPLTYASLKAIAAGLGATVIEQTLDPGTSGLIIKYAGSFPRIYISQHDSPSRKRFTLAHELGHLVERRDWANDDEYSFVDHRKTGVTNLHEFYANEFAGELLMPAEPFLETWTEEGAPGAAAHFGVSEQAARERYRRLKMHPNVND